MRNTNASVRHIEMVFNPDILVTILVEMVIDPDILVINAKNTTQGVIKVYAVADKTP